MIMKLRRAGTSPPRLIQLDILRGIAILLVLGHHPAVPPNEAGPLRGLAWFLSDFGWSGVDLFFVLSGFLIGGLLFNEIAEHGNLDIKRFLYRRGFKIWPSYYALLAYLFVMLSFRVPMAIRLGFSIELSPVNIAKKLVYNILNIQNYFYSLRDHTWSLAVEEHFYLILPFLLAWLTRRHRDKSMPITSIPAIPYIALGLIFYCTAGRYITAQSSDRLFATHLRIDALFVGVVLAYWARFSPNWLETVRRWRNPLIVAGLLLIFPMTVKQHWGHLSALFALTGRTMLILGCATILSVVVATPIGEGWLGYLLGSQVARLIAFIGFYSYPIYLWHWDLALGPIEMLRETPTGQQIPPILRWCCGMPLYVAWATVVGVVMSRLIETPALAIRDRLIPRRAQAIEPGEAMFSDAQKVEFEIAAENITSDVSESDTTSALP